MRIRGFRPGLDGDPQRAKPRFRDSGSTFEPAHRQLVLIHLGHGRSMEARYNRDTRRFWLRFGPGDYMETWEAPETWEQLPPTSRGGIEADQHFRLPRWLSALAGRRRVLSGMSGRSAKQHQGAA